MTRIGKTISILHESVGIYIPRVILYNTLSTIFPTSDFIYSLSTLTHWKKKSKLAKSVKALLESQNQFQNMIHSQFPHNFQDQDSNSLFQVTPQQEDESIDLENSIKAMIQSQNDFNQSINREKIEMSQLFNP